MTDPRFDVVIVGAGATGSLAAYELARRGLRVAVLEAGPWRELPAPDVLRAAHTPTALTRPPRAPRQATQRRCYAFGDATRHLFVDDTDHPYVTPPGQPFHWIRGRQVGGRMVLWSRTALRMSDLDFHAASRDGVGVDWPIDHAELAPYYDRVEHLLGVAAAPPPLSSTAEALRAALATLDGSPRLVAARKATVDGIPWLDALRTPAVALHTGAIASRIVLHDRSARARGVEYIDRETGERRHAWGRAVMLCASTIESLRLLLASAEPRCPGGLGNSSGLLGTHLVDHTMGIALAADLPADRLAVDRPESLYVPRFTNTDGSDCDFLRGYGLQIELAPASWISISAFGEALPRPDNCVRLDRDRKDAWGLPVPHIAMRYGENEARMHVHQARMIEAISAALGLAIRGLKEQMSAPGLSIHEAGGARMGADRRTSVLDAHNQLWDVDNVFCTDGACFPSAGTANPTLTMLALTLRACEQVAARCAAAEL